VGWYPSGQPAAGPFANPAGAAGWTRAWRGRSTLMNALLFGVAPVILAAVIVAAFLIVSPGQGRRLLQPLLLAMLELSPPTVPA
jgi:hypothetical protein